MKFDFCIGNPPYQETKGGTKNVDIWPNFVRSAGEIGQNACLIHPGRWVVPKKQMKPTRDMMINCGLKSFNYYPDASKIFNGVSIDGGITITYFEKDYTADVKYYNNGEYFGLYKCGEKFISDKYEAEAYSKVFAKFSNTINTMSIRVIGSVGSLGGSEFGYNKLKHISLLKPSPDGLADPVAVWANSGYGKGTRFSWHFIEKSELANPPLNLFNSRKIMLDKKGHAITSGKGNVINNIPQIVDVEATASGDVLFVFPENDCDYELQLIKSMFMTKTIRFLMTITQKDLYVRGFENIPDYTLFIPMLDGALFTDEWFYKVFAFSGELVEHIERSVSAKNDQPNENKEEDNAENN